MKATHSLKDADKRLHETQVHLQPGSQRCFAERAVAHPLRSVRVGFPPSVDGSRCSLSDDAFRLATAGAQPAIPEDNMYMYVRTLTCTCMACRLGWPHMSTGSDLAAHSSRFQMRESMQPHSMPLLLNTGDVQPVICTHLNAGNAAPAFEP